MRFMRKIFYHIYCFTVLLFSGTAVYGQVTISGPSCVVAGTVYQYTIRGQWDSTSTMQVCITGGLVQDSAGNSSTCTIQGTPLKAILVTWNDSASDTGSLSLTSSIGNTTLNVHFTQPLLPGSIDSASKVQMIGNDSVPMTITCSFDSGGSCSPIYVYQWQQSSDMVSWSDITGASSQNLSIDSGLTQSAYFRRKVTETVSGSVGYSDAAAVFVIINTNDSTPGNGTDSTQSGAVIFPEIKYGQPGYLYNQVVKNTYLKWMRKTKKIFSPVTKHQPNSKA
jgi:hypothetical protein